MTASRALARHPRVCTTVRTREQQLRDLLRDGRSSLDDVPRAQVRDRRARVMRDRDRCRRAGRNARPPRRSSRDEAVGGSDAASRFSPRSPAADRASYNVRRAIDDDRRRFAVVVEQSGRQGAAPDPRRDRQQHGRPRSAAARWRRASYVRMAERGCEPAHHGLVLSDFDRDRRRAAPHFRRVHLLRGRPCRPERPGRRRPDEVGELVAAFGEPRREELHAVVEFLDVIEAATFEPPAPLSRPDCADAILARQSDAVVRNQLSTASTPAGSAIGHRDVAPLLRKRHGQRDANQIAGSECRAAAPRVRSRRSARIAARRACPGHRPAADRSARTAGGCCRRGVRCRSRDEARVPVRRLPESAAAGPASRAALLLRRDDRPRNVAVPTGCAPMRRRRGHVRHVGFELPVVRDERLERRRVLLRVGPAAAAAGPPAAIAPCRCTSAGSSPRRTKPSSTSAVARTFEFQSQASAA